jgi:hypothetical protein
MALSEKTKSNLKLGFSSIISNGACIDLGRNKPWYGAIIMGLLSVILAIIPIGVTRAWVHAGDTMFATPTYEYETGLVKFEDALVDKGVSIVVDHDSKTLTATNFSALNADSDHTWYRYVNSDTKTTMFEVFYTTTTDSDFTTFCTNVYNLKNPYTGTANARTLCSYLILGPKAYIGYKYPVNATASSGYKGAASGQYDLTPSFRFEDLVKQNTHGKAYDVPREKVDATNYDTYQQEIVDTYKVFFNEGYETTKIQGAWMWTGIMAAVYVVFIVFMGLMIWLMTRGKNNPYRIYTFWETQKMSYWAAFTPAVLACGLGFAFSTYALFIFILFYGMRIMWMSMKNLRPEVASK